MAEQVDLHDPGQVEDVRAGSVKKRVAELLDIDLEIGAERLHQRIDSAERQVQDEIDVVGGAGLAL